jgi:PAS domain S-box-containing protein
MGEQTAASETDPTPAEVPAPWGEVEFRRLLEKLPAGAYTCDPDGLITYYNQRAVELWGRPPKLNDPRDRYCGSFKLFTSDGRPIDPADCWMARALRENAAFNGQEIVVERPDGSRVTVLAHSNPLRDESGRLVGAVNVLVDVTDPRRADAANALLAAIVESSDDAIVSKDLDGVILSWNAGAERIFGYTAAEAVGRSITMIIPPDRLDEETEILARLRRGERIEHFETVRQTRDGRHIDISLTVSPVRDAAGRVVAASKVARDVTDRKRAEEALRRSERELAAELRAAQHLQEVSTRLIQADDVESLYEQILDTAVAVMRSDFASMQMLYPERGGELRLLAFRGFDPEAAKFWKWVRADSTTTCGVALRACERSVVPDVMTCEFMAGTADLQVYLRTGIRAMQSTPLLSRGGRVLGMISTHWRNPHRPTERDLRLLDVLARQAADLIDRSQSEQALREADRRKDEFLATLAHELRNPLAPVRNAVQLLQAQGPPTPQAAWALGVIDRQMRQMTRLIDDLLDISRISCDKLELRRQRVALAEVVRTAVETSRPLLEAAGHQFAVAVPPEPIHLDADPTRVAQAISNLLNNAAKYTDRGGHVWLTAERQGSDAVVRVRDTGVGIPAEVLPRLFEMFTQVERSLDRAQGGLGIGLALVKQLVEMHGGSVEAHSDGPGQGSEFVVRLPVVVEPPPESPADAAGEEAAPVATLRVLVVEDNRDSAASLAMLLRIAGHDVRTAHDGLEAVGAAGEFRPDVALLDIGLPKLNGFDAARRIRQQPWSAGMVLIAVTGWGQDDDRKRSKESGFDHHMVKPVDPGALMELLGALGRTAAGRGTRRRTGAGRG